MTLRKPALLALVLLTASTAGLLAHSGATGIVKERMEAMKAIGGAMKQLGAMAKGEAAFDQAKVMQASKTISGHAAEFDRLFPDTAKSRKSHVSEALPAIWEDKPAFLALAKELRQAASGLEAVTASAGLGASMKALGSTCKGCHQKFRLKKK